MLPKNTSLGELEIAEVYEYIDGPRLFAARNNIGAMFLVFWCDEEKDATGWLYLPISEARLNSLRRKEITLNDAYREPETAYYLVYTGVPPRTDSALLFNSNAINSDFFPPTGYYIEYADVVDEVTEGWSFETKLSRKALAKSVSQFIGRFRELVEGIMSRSAKTSLNLYPLSAIAGSIQIKFGADSHGYAVEALKIVDQLLQSNSEEEFRQQLNEHEIDPAQLQEFFSSILSNELDVEIVPKLASDGRAFELSRERIQQFNEYLDQVSIFLIDSIKVPQANDIDKMLQVLRMMNDGTPLIPENIEGLTTPRQVQYYTRAAYAYELATLDEQLTTAGHFVISQPDRNSQYQILADRFESTDFGWAWMRWARVQYMTELDPKTAADFLIASVPDLSEVTARRRASTLEHWLKALQPYHRQYRSAE